MSCFVEKPGMVPFFNFSKTRDTRIGLMVNCLDQPSSKCNKLNLSFLEANYVH